MISWNDEASLPFPFFFWLCIGEDFDSGVSHSVALTRIPSDVGTKISHIYHNLVRGICLQLLDLSSRVLVLISGMAILANYK